MVMGTEEVVLPPNALLAMLAASVCVGESVIVGKKLAGNHPAVTNAVGMAVGALALLGMSIAVGETWAWPRRPEVVLSIAYLATIGSVGLFVLVLLVVRQWSASATSYMFVPFPLVTMLLGAWLADEPLTAHGIVGAGLVMTGVWFGALAPVARRADAGGSIERTPQVLETG